MQVDFFLSMLKEMVESGNLNEKKNQIIIIVIWTWKNWMDLDRNHLRPLLSLSFIDDQ